MNSGNDHEVLGQSRQVLGGATFNSEVQLLQGPLREFIEYAFGRKLPECSGNVDKGRQTSENPDVRFEDRLQAPPLHFYGKRLPVEGAGPVHLCHRSCSDWTRIKFSKEFVKWLAEIRLDHLPGRFKGHRADVFKQIVKFVANL